MYFAGVFNTMYDVINATLGGMGCVDSGCLERRDFRLVDELGKVPWKRKGFSQWKMYQKAQGSEQDIFQYWQQKPDSYQSNLMFTIFPLF